MATGFPDKSAGGRDKKGLPDGGYTSEAEEPPESYFEGMSRDRDRQRISDRAKRKAMRATAKAGWAALACTPASYVRQTEHGYTQNGPNCAAHCAAFVSLRYLGYTVVQTIALLRTLNQAGKLARWQKESDSSTVKFIASTGDSTYSNFIATRMSTVLAEIREEAHLYSEKLSPANAARLSSHQASRLPRPDIFYPQVIGQFPRQDWSAQNKDFYATRETQTYFHTTLRKGANTVQNSPRAPASTPVSTFQSALFSNLQPCRSTAIPHPTLKGPQAQLIRSATPFVHMDIRAFWEDGRPCAHAIVADFSDPQHPGIFDPNFGWMAPTSGFCHLDFEQALVSIWEFYTRNISQVAGRQGMATLKPDQQAGLFFYASQIYVQSMPPAPDLKLPPSRK